MKRKITNYKSWVNMGGMIDTLIANITHKIFAFKFDKAWLRLDFTLYRMNQQYMLFKMK